MIQIPKIQFQKKLFLKRAGDMAQWLEFLPCIHKTMGLVPSNHKKTTSLKPSMMAHTYNPNTEELRQEYCPEIKPILN